MPNVTKENPCGGRMPEPKPMLEALSGNVVRVPPVWLMRQAGRYLPEYRSVRARAGDFLSLCYNPELAAEVTLQPIRRFGFDAAILFADILLVPHALGINLTFNEGEGPRLSPVTGLAGVRGLRPAEEIHQTLSPVYQTIKILKQELPQNTALIGFAGAPWTVATYMIAGRSEVGHPTSLAFMRKEPQAFDYLIDTLVEATISYLLAQAAAGADILKLFDSWAGSLTGDLFDRYAAEPARRIIASLKAEYPDIPVIAFPRNAGNRYIGFASACGADCTALDPSVDLVWAARHVQKEACVQGNLDPKLLQKGGPAMARQVRRIRETLCKGPFIFGLGHGITPNTNPENVYALLDIVREEAS